MPALPEAASQAWDHREGPVVLTTVDPAGIPNAIYASCVKKFSEDKLVVADNYFNKTRNNIQNGSKGAILYITAEGKAFQVKGTIEYLTSGEIFEDMQTWVDCKHPRVAAAVMNVEEVYSGADKLL